MKIVNLPLAKLKPYKGNPRKNEAAIAGVARSIEQFGFRQPIVVDRKMVIVCGHTRYHAAKKLKLKTVPVHVATDLTDEQARAYRLADNKTSEKAEWDEDLLAIEIQALEDCGVELAPLGFDADELKRARKKGKEAEKTAASETGPPVEAQLQYKIVIECKDEKHQLKLLEKLTIENIECKPLIV